MRASTRTCESPASRPAGAAIASPATRTGTARAEEILVGTLGVDLVDARTEDHRVARVRDEGNRRQGRTGQTRQEHHDASVQKLFKNYPPARSAQ